MIAHAGGGHIGGDYSVADILVTLVLYELNLDPAFPLWPERDRLILSKGHTAGALYIALAMAGFFPVEELMTFMDPLSRLSGHPNRRYLPGVEANTGTLGHGLPIAAGSALAAKSDGSSRRVFVLLGDGEMQEGSNWEAMMFASHQGLDNLIAVVDRNHLQQGATTEATVDLEPLGAKAAAFGFSVIDCDAHDIGELLDVFGKPPTAGKPRFVIAHSHKGHPVSFIADQVGWHHHVPSDSEIDRILEELEPDQ
jgi:transketolase